MLAQYLRIVKLFVAKQIAEKAGINIHTLNHYLSGRKSMPPADVAVRIARALGVSVEFLVTGEEAPDARNTIKHGKPSTEADISKYSPLYDLLDDLSMLPKELFLPLKAMIKAARSCYEKMTG